MLVWILIPAVPKARPATKRPTFQENAGDILAEAKQINADRAAAEAYVEDEEVAEAEETQTEEAQAE